MNFVDDILDVCSKAVDTAIDKTGEVIDYSKNRLDRSSLKVKIREKYQVLGKLCYDMTETGDDDMGTMKRIIADIRSLKDELAKLEDDTARREKTKVCKVCHAKNPSASLYCAKCGEKL